MKILDETIYHIGLSKEQGAGYAILPGDPGRVEKIASLLDAPTFVAQNREFTTWAGTLLGERVLVTSTGIGGPSAAIAVEELYRVGVRTMLRVGTCGGMQTQVQTGDIVIPTGSIRLEGTSKEYMPAEFPAVPDFEALTALVQAAKNKGRRYHTGVVQCKDSFYGQHEPDSLPNGKALREKWDTWIKGGALASEMETASLFIVAASRGIRAGALLFTVWNQERENRGLSNPVANDTAPAVETVVEAMRLLIEADKRKA